MKQPLWRAALLMGAVVLAALALWFVSRGGKHESQRTPAGVGLGNPALQIGGRVGSGADDGVAGAHAATVADAEGTRDADISCVTSRGEVEVRGMSLATLAPPGTKLTLLAGFYRCNEVRRGDWVAIRYAGDVRPLVKVVHAVPGDRFALEMTPQGEQLLVNGEPARNSQGVPFRIDPAADRMLGPYVRAYHGVIPKDAYLVFGDQPERTVDSRMFGLVARADLLGRLVLSAR